MDTNFAPMTYHPKHSKDFNKIFKKYGIKPAFVNKFNTKSSFHSKLKDRTPDDEKSGIYKIRCLDCEKVHVGQTKRSIKKRGQEHRRNAVNKQIDRSAVAKHFS